MWIIYMCENLINGKLYIGQTIGKLSKRRSKHFTHARDLRNNEPFARALRKYGKENFKWSILQSIPEGSYDALNEAEIFWIDYFDSRVPNGYNVDKGGRGHHYVRRPDESTEAARQKNLGQKRTAEQRKNMSKAHLGVPLGEEHARHMAEAHWKKVRVKTLEVICESVKATAIYLIENGYTTSKNVNSVKSCISQAITHNKKYLDLEFELVSA